MIPNHRPIRTLPLRSAACTLPLLFCWAATSMAQTTPADALKAATETARGIRKATRATPPPPPKLPAGDPCSALPLADVQRVFPGARAGQRSARLEEYGITECQWRGAAGGPVLVLQETYSSATSARDEALGMAQGFVDPMRRDALKNVRIESFPGIGVDSAAFVETTDPKRGIVGDGALLELWKGGHTVSLASPELPSRDRTVALKALETLGRLASSRLQATP